MARALAFYREQVGDPYAVFEREMRHPQGHHLFYSVSAAIRHGLRVDLGDVPPGVEDVACERVWASAWPTTATQVAKARGDG